MDIEKEKDNSDPGTFCFLWYYIKHVPHMKELSSPEEAMKFMEENKETTGFWPIFALDSDRAYLIWYNDQVEIETLKEESRKANSYLNHIS